MATSLSLLLARHLYVSGVLVPVLGLCFNVIITDPWPVLCPLCIREAESTLPARVRGEMCLDTVVRTAAARAQLDAPLLSHLPSRVGGGTGLSFLSSITLPSCRLPGTRGGNLPLPFLTRYIIYVHLGD